MKKYTVRIPISGSMSFDVDATSEGEAMEKAWEAYNKGHSPNVSWDALAVVATGNVFHGVLNEAEVEECS